MLKLNSKLIKLLCGYIRVVDCTSFRQCCKH